MKQISIIGGTFYGNRGAEGMLCTVIGELRGKFGDNIKFNVFSYYPDTDRSLVNTENIKIYSSTPGYLVLVMLPCAFIYRLLGVLHLKPLQKYLPEAVRSLASSSALTCIAGVSFIEGRTKFIAFNIATIWPAILMGVPVIKLSQALGPFERQPNRFAAKLFLSRCEKIFSRGRITDSYLQSLFGKTNKFERADDLAFLFQKEYCVSRDAPDLKRNIDILDIHKKEGKTIVGVCPSVVVSIQTDSEGLDYKKIMQDILIGLVKNNYIIAFYPNATRGDDMDKDHNNDLPLMHEILMGLDKITEKNIIGFTGSYNAAQIHQIIGACDVNVVSRFHAMIASLTLCIPVMVIGWSHKYLEVMERFGQEDMVLDYKQGNVSPALEHINKVIVEREIRIRQISEELDKVKGCSTQQITYLIKFLEKKICK